MKTLNAIEFNNKQKDIKCHAIQGEKEKYFI